MNIEDIKKKYKPDTYDSMWDRLLDTPTYVLAEIVLESLPETELDAWAIEIEEDDDEAV
jgi:hypothetical protein